MKNIRRYFKRHPRIGFTIDFVATAICLMIAYLLLPGMLGTLIAVAGLLFVRSLLGAYWSSQEELASYYSNFAYQFRNLHEDLRTVSGCAPGAW
ncbi:hypothetical protein [Bacillus glycinifermentans]|uniref:Uncharacterized protein n=1 Tax=Bacillus glycinifermentans TaxID=1664069 RepID=A0A0T6BQZ0_9BACI|nr:hypothetical protein [Bacillus glycinifermentans]ATH92676.1 hypothetical protein COP00_08645 [Bacillus glycinifermentans]KRT94047.1 hypothetical protein AB447_215510 [Bacillus glycinifermentans]MEC0487437.1 hypothetical protein [Bacillus glycinifermentans]MEC0493444.1 hypothetical protein [Bacillus glycinifermentans]MEC0541823.1 hypothetical protein [Bacillus glycinifermentans]